MLRQKGLRSRVLLSTILDLINDSNKLSEMSKVTKSFAKPDAAEDLANLILSKIKDDNKSSTDAPPGRLCNYT